ncbi:hypothetical protein H5410_055196 [Solanum commersonii]|uniref:Uncharacterized protein n=1 Tax=Solanum commersonii TaxID=4109 RepID=A0A9J5WJM2_SOLCO|nr:hypothetical protein H5410_055196 [Solanum commersonii]
MVENFLHKCKHALGTFGIPSRSKIVNKQTRALMQPESLLQNVIHYAFNCEPKTAILLTGFNSLE